METKTINAIDLSVQLERLYPVEWNKQNEREDDNIILQGNIIIDKEYICPIDIYFNIDDGFNFFEDALPKINQNSFVVFRKIDNEIRIYPIEWLMCEIPFFGLASENDDTTIILIRVYDIDYEFIKVYCDTKLIKE
jgi:hypothetical protein